MTDELTPNRWTGRDDGPGPEHRRWHHVVNESLTATAASPTSVDKPVAPGIAILGFASDEGVRRNKGRTGAAAGPSAIRLILASLQAPTALQVHDRGDIIVSGEEMEAGQERLGEAVSSALKSGHLPIVLGGGHETAFGSYLGLRQAGVLDGQRLGIINLDAHFDLRADPIPSSGTPFLQIALMEKDAGRDLTYRIMGISEPNNTLELFQTAERFGAKFLTDEECGSASRTRVREFVNTFLDGVDAVYLTIDLDVLPAYVAPGVSAPASLGVPYEVILEVCQQLARSPKLKHVDVVELNPQFDLDNRTARSAARLIHAIAVEHSNHGSSATPTPSHLTGIELS